MNQYIHAMVQCIRQAISGGVHCMAERKIPDHKMAEVIIMSLTASTFEIVKHVSEDREEFNNLLKQVQNVYKEEIEKGEFYDSKTATH